MPEHEVPPTPDPGTNQISRERWGRQLIQIITDVQKNVDRLEQFSQRTQEELVKICKGVDMSVEHEKESIKFKAESTEKIRSLKVWTNWALGVGVLLLTTMGGANAYVVSNQNSLLTEIRNLTTNQDKDRQIAKDAIEVLRGSVKSAETSIHQLELTLKDISHSLVDLNRKSDAQSTQVDKVVAVVEEIKKSRGESFSEFVTQRSLLRKDELRVRDDKKGPLVFDIKPFPESQSPFTAARSARPSAVLATPHAAFLDQFGFQLKIRRIDDGTFQVRLFSQEATLAEIEDFLKNGHGVIPIDLTIRAPIEQ